MRFAVEKSASVISGNMEPDRQACRISRRRTAAVAALLVTDINRRFAAAVQKKKMTGHIDRISDPHVEQDEIFDMPEVVSARSR